MSAILGGTDSLSVLPFDSVFKKPNSFSYRIARNTQIILKEEAFFDKVIDPSGGSYYIESLTYSFIQEAWKMFLKIDESGGFLESLKNGFIQSQIREMAQKRMNYIASRRETLLGTNQYPNFNEVILKNIDWDVYSSDKVTSQTTIEPLKKIRLGKEIEDLRLRTEKSGKRPKVFMLTIGNLAMRLARSQFSCNFFAVAGFEVIDNNGFESIEEGIDTALKSKSDIIVLCSSDDEYAEYAPRAFKYLNNKAIFVVAGMPACIEQLKAEGINNYISIKSNLLETLKYYQSLLKIE